mmetsp:Transcript_116203/g.369793  ORF Transcript_116203/g.369793 Transcript_116203/m.369793 type:complete len:432 (+) Transcript_116203:527-1822(+)
MWRRKCFLNRARKPGSRVHRSMPRSNNPSAWLGTLGKTCRLTQRWRRRKTTSQRLAHRLPRHLGWLRRGLATRRAHQSFQHHRAHQTSLDAGPRCAAQARAHGAEHTSRPSGARELQSDVLRIAPEIASTMAPAASSLTGHLGSIAPSPNGKRLGRLLLESKMAMARGLRDARSNLLPSIQVTQVERRPSLARGDVVEQPAGQSESASHRSSQRQGSWSLSAPRTSVSLGSRRGVSLSFAGESLVGSTSGISTTHGSISSASTASSSNRLTVDSASRMMVTVLNTARHHRRSQTGPSKQLRLDPISPVWRSERSDRSMEEDKLSESSSQARLSSGQVDAAFGESFGMDWKTGEDLQIDSQVAPPQDDFVEACAQAAKAPCVAEVGFYDMPSTPELPGPPSTPDSSGRLTQVRGLGPAARRRQVSQANYQTS